ncbi:AT hook motif DNA-binding family protein [Trifolium repens]|nr:AT hook motif DNA-binding family protein [Trifolium repens]
MESREANHENEQPSPTSPPLPQPQLSHHNLQTATMVMSGPNPFTNSTVATTMMTPVTAQFPLLNMNTNHSPHSDGFNNNINNTLTAPPAAHSTALMPCMTPVVGDSSSNFPSDSVSVKKKRGRPRKYFAKHEVDSGLGSSSGSGSGSGQAQAADVAPPPPSPPAADTPFPDSLMKSTRGRGRPRGSFNKKNDVEVHGGLAGTCFSPYVIIVNRGEDIIAKVTAACYGGPNFEVCILSVHGYVSTAALHVPGNILTYEGGPYEILSLSGTLLPGNNGSKRMGSWTVSLGGGPKAQIWGGVVADKLIAASSVKVILGCFSVDGKKTSLNNQNSQPPPVPFEFAASGSTPTPTGATSQVHYLSESSGDNEEIPFDQGGPSEVYNDDDQLIPNLTMYQQMWDYHYQP